MLFYWEGHVHSLSLDNKRCFQRKKTRATKRNLGIRTKALRQECSLWTNDFIWRALNVFAVLVMPCIYNVHCLQVYIAVFFRSSFCTEHKNGANSYRNISCFRSELWCVFCSNCDSQWQRQQTQQGRRAKGQPPRRVQLSKKRFSSSAVTKRQIILKRISNISNHNKNRKLILLALLLGRGTTFHACVRELDGELVCVHETMLNAIKRLVHKIMCSAAGCVLEQVWVRSNRIEYDESMHNWMLLQNN